MYSHYPIDFHKWSLYILYITRISNEKQYLYHISMMIIVYHDHINLYYINGIGSLRFEHSRFSTQIRRLTNLALTRFVFNLYLLHYSENIRFERMWLIKSQISFKLTTINHSVNSLLFFRNYYFKIENWFLSDLNAKLTLIKSTLYLIKLRNLLNWRKRDDSNIQVFYTIFSKYLALPIATFPLRPMRFELIL